MTTTMRDLIDKEEEYMVTKEVELNQRIRGKGPDRAYDPTYEPSWRPLDDGKDNHYKGKDNQVIQFEFDTGQELEEWAEAIVAAISRLSVIGLTQTDLTAEM